MNPTPSTPDGPARLLIDTHVHLHPEHRLADVYANAAARFTRESPEATGVLMLTHTTRARASGPELADAPGGWAFEPIEPGLSGAASHPEHGRLLLVTGHQIVTREKLEVLAMGTISPPPDFLTLGETLDKVRAVGGFPVLPWGFGKWWGTRGQTVQNTLQAVSRGTLALGDNAGRPLGYPTPRLFALAQQRGIPVLPGTDPLAIPGHTTRPARFGCRLQASLDPLAPAASILNHLRDLRESPKTFGSRIGPLRFMLDQVSIRARKATNTGGSA